MLPRPLVVKSLVIYESNTWSYGLPPAQVLRGQAPHLCRWSNKKRPLFEPRGTSSWLLTLPGRNSAFRAGVGPVWGRRSKVNKISTALETPKTDPTISRANMNSWCEHISLGCSINSGGEHTSPGNEHTRNVSVHAKRQPKPSAQYAVQTHEKQL